MEYGQDSKLLRNISRNLILRYKEITNWLPRRGYFQIYFL